MTNGSLICLHAHTQLAHAVSKVGPELLPQPVGALLSRSRRHLLRGGQLGPSALYSGTRRAGDDARPRRDQAAQLAHSLFRQQVRCEERGQRWRDQARARHRQTMQRWPRRHSQALSSIREQFAHRRRSPHGLLVALHRARQKKQQLKK